MANRTSVIKRKTKETDITLELNIDGIGRVDFRDLKLFADYWLVLLAPGAVVPLP